MTVKTMLLDQAPRPVRSILRGLRRRELTPRWLRIALLDWSSRNSFLAGIYVLVSGAFRHEHRAVVAGRLRHLREREGLGEGVGALYALRRNIHRLEKGILMRPRRPVFAADYIEETVQLFATCSQIARDRGDLGGLLYWARDVLDNFFEIAGPHPAIDRARIAFDRVLAVRPVESGSRKPYRRSVEPVAVEYEQILRLAKRRRSVRWFKPERVPRGLVDAAIDVARYSPSACNRQPFHFRVYDEPELAKEITAIPMGTVGYSDNVPCVVVLTGRLHAFPFPRDRHVIYIDAALAAMAFELALETLGLSSCSINWPEIPAKEQEMSRALSLAPDERVIMLIAVGFPDPDGLIAYSEKKPIEEIRSYNLLDRTGPAADERAYERTDTSSSNDSSASSA